MPIGRDTESLKRLARYHIDLLRQAEVYEDEHLAAIWFLHSIVTERSTFPYMLAYGADHKYVYGEDFVGMLSPFLKDALGKRRHCIVMFQSENEDNVTIYDVHLVAKPEYARYRQGNRVWDVQNNRWIEVSADVLLELRVDTYDNIGTLSLEEPL